MHLEHARPPREAGFRAWVEWEEALNGDFKFWLWMAHRERWVPGGGARRSMW